jgi:hypothetical protein
MQVKDYRNEVYNCVTSELMKIEYDGNVLSSDESLAVLSILNFISIALLLIKDMEVNNIGILDLMNRDDYEGVEAALDSVLNELKSDAEFADEYNIDVNLLPESLESLAEIAIFTLATNAKDNQVYKDLMSNTVN